MCIMIMSMWSIFVFSVVLCNCESLSSEVKQRPTLHLKNAIEFYNTTIKLEEKVDSILLQLNGEQSNYQDTFQKPAMDLTANLHNIAEELEKFKAKYKGGDFPLKEYKTFMESINSKFLEISSLSNEVMPKFSEGMEKIEEDKNSLFKEISKFLTKRLEFEKNIVQLEDFGIFLDSQSETDVEAPAFDVALLNELYEKMQVQDLENESVNKNEDSFFKVEELSSTEDELVTTNQDQKKLGDFVPTVNKALGTIQEKIELIGEKYDEIFSRWLTTAEEVTLAEQKIMDLKEKLELNFNTNARNEL